MKIGRNVMIMSLAALAAGVIVLVLGHTETGVYLIAAAMGATLLAKGVERYKKLVFIPLLLCTQGCLCSGHVRVEAIQGSVKRLVARHDTYIQADPTLSEVKKRVYLRTGIILLDLLNTASDKKR